jgi:hypothetical protein
MPEHLVLKHGHTVIPIFELDVVDVGGDLVVIQVPQLQGGRVAVYRYPFSLELLGQSGR